MLGCKWLSTMPIIFGQTPHRLRFSTSLHYRTLVTGPARTCRSCGNENQLMNDACLATGGQLGGTTAVRSSLPEPSPYRRRPSWTSDHEHSKGNDEITFESAAKA